MITPRLVLVAILGSAVGTACTHSDSFPTSPDRPDGAFGTERPTRLTYNAGDDRWPVVSGPGRLSYQFRRGTPDRDFCAGVMPAIGGGRIAEVCAWEVDDASRSDLFGAAVLLDDGRFLWTRHEGNTGNPSPQEGGLYLGPRDSPRDATQILPLLVQPTGASARWDLLVDPVQTGPGEIMALAAQWFIGQTVAFGPVDTIIRGIEIARIDVTAVPARITVVAPAMDAIAWSRDPRDGQIHILRPTYAPASAGSQYRPIADTVFVLGSGGATPVWGRPNTVDEISGRAEGIATAAGKLFVTYNWLRPLPPTPGVPPGFETASLLAEVRGGVELGAISTRYSTSSDRWGRVAIAQDGSSLIVESVLPSGRDLYRFALP